MAFETVGELFSMGGHGLYVWLSYGIGLLVILALTLMPLRDYRKAMSLVRQHHRQSTASHSAASNTESEGVN